VIDFTSGSTIPPPRKAVAAFTNRRREAECAGSMSVPVRRPDSFRSWIASSATARWPAAGELPKYAVVISSTPRSPSHSIQISNAVRVTLWYCSETGSSKTMSPSTDIHRENSSIGRALGLPQLSNPAPDMPDSSPEPRSAAPTEICGHRGPGRRGAGRCLLMPFRQHNGISAVVQ
jgi:hypothetical protein